MPSEDRDEHDHDHHHGEDRPRGPPAERHAPQHQPGDRRDEPDGHPPPPQFADEPVDGGVRRALLGDRGPGHEVGEHAGAAEERRSGEQDAEQHRVHAEVLAQAAGDTGPDPVATAAAQHASGRWWSGGRGEAAGFVSRSHGDNSVARMAARHRVLP